MSVATVGAHTNEFNFAINEAGGNLGRSKVPVSEKILATGLGKENS
jgi:hypothetical protein